MSLDASMVNEAKKDFMGRNVHAGVKTESCEPELPKSKPTFTAEEKRRLFDGTWLEGFPNLEDAQINPEGDGYTGIVMLGSGGGDAQEEIGDAGETNEEDCVGDGEEHDGLQEKAMESEQEVEKGITPGSGSTGTKNEQEYRGLVGGQGN